ncbi:Two-component system response regulator [Burkholderiales bacterium]|jgi:DNA-binding NtrC family response regulator|nr:Two-component system response regulator [Burkholderiales bacterium]
MPFDALEVHMANILVVDDEIGIRELLSEILADEGHVVTTAESAASARALRRQSTPDLILLDIWMPDTDGVTLLKEWVAGGQLTAPVIMMSGHATLETAGEATRLGALDFLEKPIALARLLGAVRTGLEHGQRLRGPRNVPSGGPGGEEPPSLRTRPASGEPVVRETSAPTAQSLSINLDQPLREARDQFERVYFEYQLSKESYSMTRVADRAGLERTHLYRKLKQLGVELGRGARRAERFDDPSTPGQGTAAAPGQDE